MKYLIASLAMLFCLPAVAADPLVGVPTYATPRLRVSSCSPRRSRWVTPPPQYGVRMQQFKWMGYKYKGTSRAQMANRIYHAQQRKAAEAEKRAARRAQLARKQQ